MTESDALTDLPRMAAETPAAELPALVGRLAQAQAVALARLTTPPAQDHRPEVQDGNISVAEAARLLGVSKSYLYKNAQALPFMVKIGRRRVCSTSRLGTVESVPAWFLTSGYLDFYASNVAKNTKAKKVGPQTMKTSMSLPVDLWTAARIEALKRGIDAQDLVAEALAAHLKKVGTK